MFERITDYGFTWGGVLNSLIEVTRLGIFGKNRVISIKTSKEELLVKITPTGLIRIENYRGSGPDFLIRRKN